MLSIESLYLCDSFMIFRRYAQMQGFFLLCWTNGIENICLLLSLFNFVSGEFEVVLYAQKSCHTFGAKAFEVFTAV